jgi:two-component system chemotaxis sensor kinase CheA
MIERKNKKSLKRRITRMVSSINFYSLLIMLFAMMIALGLTLKTFSVILTKNAASQMSYQLMDNLRKEMKQGKITSEFTNITPEYERIFKSLGISYELPLKVVYKFLDEKHENLNTQLPSRVNLPMRGDRSNLSIEYKIWKDNELVYSSAIIGPSENLSKIDNFLMEKLNNKAEEQVKDDEGNELYRIEVRLNPLLITIIYIVLISICLIVFLIILFLSKLVTHTLITILIKPLSDLDLKMQEMANGNIEAAINTEIKFKKPIIEVQKLASSSNIIMSRMHEYINTLANQNTELEAQNLTLQETSSTLANINQTLDGKNSKLRNIFDNVEQGFLTFKRDLTIHSEYSLECEKIFNEGIANRKLSLLLYPENANMEGFIDDLFVKIFDCSNSQKELYLPLLPEEIKINDKIVSLSYKVVKDERNENVIMVILTDITEKRCLEKLMDEESNTLKMVVKTIINREEFREMVNEYEDFASRCFKNISDKEHDEIFRQIHNFKGNFSQFLMINIVSKLDELETKLYEMNDTFTINDINSSALRSWLKEDLDVIETYVGKDFIKDGEICYIKREHLNQIEKKIIETLSPNECRVILPLIKSLRYKSLKDLLRTYPDYVMQLSERLSKSINPLIIKGDDVLVDTNYYQNALKSLVHIFRNCIDHGIETEDERLEHGKSQIGNIDCEIKELKDDFQIIISDDGRGIDVAAVEEKAISLGLYTREELENMDYNKKINFIHEQGLTTKEKATYISGRGVGMSAVKQCITKYNGTIELQTELGVGTKFIITLPKLQDFEVDLVSPSKFMEELVVTANRIINSQTSLIFEAKNIECSKIISLNKITALLSLKGTLNCILMISVNESMAEKLVKGFMIDDIHDEDILNYVEDVLGEISNTIIGSTFGSFENTNNIFHIGMPAVLSNKDAYIKYTESQILSCKLNYGENEISINMLLVEDKININETEEEL